MDVNRVHANRATVAMNKFDKMPQLAFGFHYTRPPITGTLFPPADPLVAPGPQAASPVTDRHRLSCPTGDTLAIRGSPRKALVPSRTNVFFPRSVRC